MSPLEHRKAEDMITRSNLDALWTALAAFFKDNPGWE